MPRNPAGERPESGRRERKGASQCILSLMIRTPPQSSWDGKGKGSKAGNQFFMNLIRRFGILPAYLFLFFPCVAYTLFDVKAKVGIRALRTRLGLRTGLLDYYRHFYAFGLSLVDRIAFLVRPRSRFSYHCSREELIADAARDGAGVILLGSHVGNWEIAGNLLVDRIGAPVNIVMLQAEKEALMEVYRPAFEQRRVHIIAMTEDGSGTAVECMAALHRGEIVALLGDRTKNQTSEEFEFLGFPARFPRGPFALALASGAPIIPVFTIKTGLRCYTFSAGDPIILRNVSREDRDMSVHHALGQYVRSLENIVRSHPHEWFNFYDFWKEKG